MGVGTNLVHVDRPLTRVALSFAQAGGFVGRWLAPVVPVVNKSDKYWKFDPNRRAVAQVYDGRAPGDKANEIKRFRTTDSYDCSGHALSEGINDEEVANDDSPMDPFVDSMETLMGHLLLNREIATKAAIDAGIAAAGGSHTSSPGTKWNAASGKPITDIRAKKAVIRAACGREPNVLVMDVSVLDAIMDNAEVLDRVVGGATTDNPALVNAQLLGQIVGIQNVVIAGVQNNTAQEGQTASVSQVWTDSVYLAYSRLVDPRIKQPSGAYTFQWTPESGPMEGFGAQRERENLNHRTVAELSGYYDVKYTMKEALASLTDVLS